MNDDQELETWKQEWSAMGSAELLAERLAERAQRNVLRARLGGALEAVGAVFSTGLCAWFAVRTHGDLRAIVLGLVVAASNGASLMR